jgi:peptidoglycan/LPS O-acetylase OafA/YrhL
MKPSPGTERAIDGLRALALLWTMAFHSVWIAGLRVGASHDEVTALFTAPGWRLVMRADFAVDIFFVLSGYLLALGLLRERARAGTVDVRGFYRRRFFRLAPVYYVLIVVTAALARIDVDWSWANVLFVNNYLPLAHEFMPWSWSLALEVQFCLALPLLFLVSERGFVPLAVGLIVAGMAIRAWAALRHGIALPIAGHPLLDGPRYHAYFDYVYQPSHTRFGAFLCGAIAAHGVHSGWAARWFAARPHGARTALLLSFVVMATLIALPAADPGARWPTAAGLAYLALFPTLFSAAASVLLLAALGGWSRPLTRFLSAPGFHPIAQLSYATFLAHPLIMFVGSFTLLGPEPLGLGARAGLYVGYVAVSFVVAAGLHVVVEAPFLARARRTWTR